MFLYRKYKDDYSFIHLFFYNYYLKKNIYYLFILIIVIIIFGLYSITCEHQVFTVSPVSGDPTSQLGNFYRCPKVVVKGHPVLHKTTSSSSLPLILLVWFTRFTSTLYCSCFLFHCYIFFPTFTSARIAK